MFHAVRSCLSVVAVVAAAAVASGAHAQSCPLVVNPAGGGQFTDIQPAVDYFKANLGNLGPCLIDVRPGVYTNSVSVSGVNVGASGDSQRLVIRGTRGPGANWLSQFNTGRRDAISLKGSRFVSVEDFDVLGGTNKPISVEGGNASSVNRGISVARNNVHDNGGGRDSGCVNVADGNEQTLVVNNVCWSNHADNIVIGKVGAQNAVVNNTVFNSEKSGISVAKTANVVIANNLVLFTATGVGAGIDLVTSGGGSAGDRRLLNNIVYGSGSSGDIPNLASATVKTGNKTTATIGAGLLATAFLLDPAAANFRLAGGSPALNAGIASTGTPNRVPAADFEGDPRADAAPDVGFDEVSDADFDGQPDIADNCPPGLNSSYNPTQDDRDGDGVGDYCDNCPKVANPGQEDVNGFDAAGNATGAPNGRGDACEEIGESLFQCQPGPAGSCLFVATFGALGDVDTIPPDYMNTLFVCKDSLGHEVPWIHYLPGRTLPDDIEHYSDGDQATIFRNLSDQLVTAALTNGTYTCRACYLNDVQDEDLDGTGSCTNTLLGCEDLYQGMTCSAPTTLVIDSTLARTSCSPGFWKNNLAQWSAAGHSPSEDFDTTFGVDLFSPDITLGTAVGLGGGYPNDLARHSTAGLLSAGHPGVNYPYSVEQIRLLVQAGDPQNLLAAASALNNCPLSSNP